MKFSIAVATVLLSAIAVNASHVYHFKFDTVEGAQSCQDKNTPYINKVSKSYEFEGSDLFMVLKNDCNPVIAQNINEVCGGVASSECY
ncbi:unnamed protein product [Mucor hiemalis]